MTSPEFVFGLMGFSTDPAASDITRPLADLYTALFRSAALRRGRAWHDRREIRPDHEVTPRQRRSLSPPAGIDPAGRVAATDGAGSALTEAGRDPCRSCGPPTRRYTPDKRGHWTIDIRGRPTSDDPGDRRGRPGVPPVARADRRDGGGSDPGIPDVVAAPPGFFAYRPPAAWSAA